MTWYFKLHACCFQLTAWVFDMIGSWQSSLPYTISVPYYKKQVIVLKSCWQIHYNLFLIKKNRGSNFKFLTKPNFPFNRDLSWPILHFASIFEELILSSTGRSRLWCGWLNFTGLTCSSMACKCRKL